jgi:hypothetical protein
MLRGRFCLRNSSQDESKIICRLLNKQALVAFQIHFFAGKNRFLCMKKCAWKYTENGKIRVQAGDLAGEWV